MHKITMAFQLENSTTEICKDPAEVTSALDTADAPMQSNATQLRCYPQHVNTSSKVG